MRYIKIIIVYLALCVGLLSSSALFAADEEGLIPGLFKKFTKKEKTKEAPSTKKTAAGKLEPQKKTEVIPSPKPISVAPPSTPQTTAHGKMSKDDLIKEIKSELEDDEVLDAIPALKKQKGENGGVFYTYRVDDKDVKLEDLDEIKLNKVLQIVYQQARRIETDRINEQLEIIRRTREMTRVPPAPPAAPTRSAGVVTTPPSPPAQPRSPSAQPPRTPSSPPAPPRR